MEETESLEALSELLTQLSANPYDLSLHAQHVQLAQSAGLDEQVQAARQMLVGFWPASDDVWMPMIDARMAEGMDSMEDIAEILAMFDAAEEDYLCVY